MALSTILSASVDRMLVVDAAADRVELDDLDAHVERLEMLFVGG